MKSVVVHALGEPEQLVYDEAPKPILIENWSLEKVMRY